MTAVKGLMERLADGPVICAEGYLFALERRGHLQAGPFVPAVVLENPDAVKMLTAEFLDAGSDVALALTYYGHREKMKLVGLEGELEDLNRAAIRLAREVAAPRGALVAGDLSNTNIYNPEDPESHKAIRAIFEEQTQWAVEEGVDFMLAETMSWQHEAEIAVEVMKASGLPAVINMSIHQPLETRDGYSPLESLKRLAGMGADVVGFNCQRGPKTTLPLLEGIADAIAPTHLASVPVPYRTFPGEPTFQSLRDPQGDNLPRVRPFPTALDPFTCTRFDIEAYTKKAAALGVTFHGLCCGAAPHHLRAMAEALGRTPPASKNSEDMNRHFAMGRDPRLLKLNQDYERFL